MPDEKRPLKVFLCHASTDKPKVRELYRYLKRRGIQPWSSVENLLPGQNRQTEISKTLDESDIIIICLSQDSVSEEGFVQKEIRFALERALEMPEGRIFLIPVRLDPCDIPRSLRDYQEVDLFDKSHYGRLMKTFKFHEEQLEKARIEKDEIAKRRLPYFEAPITRNSATLHDSRNSAKVVKEASTVQHQSDQSAPEKPLHEVASSIKPETPAITINNYGTITGRVVAGSENAVQSQTALSVESSDKKTAQVQWALTDALQDGKPYISIDITNKENCLIKCYCYIKSVELNGVLRDDIKRDIVKHTARVSWSGGSDEDVGIKYIDPMGFGRLNLASLDDKISVKYPLQFETAKGPQYKGHDGKFFLQFGDYTIVLGLSCAADGVEFVEIPIVISFNYAEEHQPGGDNHIKWTETYQILRLLPKDKSLSPQIENLDKSEKPGSPPPVKKKEPEKPPRKIKTEYIVAIITAAATIIAGIFSSPWIEKWLMPASVPMPPAITATLTTPPTQVLSSATIISETKVPTATFTVLPPSETPEQNLTLAETATSTITPIAFLEVYDPHPVADDYHDAFGIHMRLVPAGEFTMGNDNSAANEKPVHLVYLNAFYMDKYEVTNALYKMCVDVGVCKKPNSLGSYYDNSTYDVYPVVGIGSEDAKIYCEWRDAKLPSEAEWEKSARGTDGRIYPWGNIFDCQKGNFDDETEISPETVIGGPSCDGYSRIAPVGRYPKGQSPFGIYDMAGNAREWVADLYNPYPGNMYSDTWYGKGPVIRGGSWLDPENILMSSNRGKDLPPYHGSPGTNGFRCARNAQP